MLVAPLDLVCLHGGWIDSINDILEVVLHLRVADYVEVARQLITVQVAANRHELAALVRVCILNKFIGVLSSLIGEVGCYLVSLSGRHILLLLLIRLTHLCRGSHGIIVVLIDLRERFGLVDGLRLLSRHLGWSFVKEIHFSLVHELGLIALDD